MKNSILIDVPMPIETPRLILRNAQAGDGAAVFEAKKESFAELHQWMPWANELGTKEETEAGLRNAHAEFILRKDLMMVGFDKASGKFIIATGLHRMDWDEGYFEIGYWVRTGETGKGYASETANALLRFAFNALGAKKVAIAHAGGNDGSKRVIEKLGFLPRGIIEDDEMRPDGTRSSSHFYARYDLNGLPDLNVTWGPRHEP